jgi:pimeloyl-ACP methyl ester carboxylesterase
MGFIASNNLTLYIKREGSRGKQPLVFINSLGSDLRIWDDVVLHFADHFQTIRIDKRGHGLSDCPPAPYSLQTLTDDVVALLDVLGVNTAVLIGDSVGGMTRTGGTIRKSFPWGSTLPTGSA